MTESPSHFETVVEAVPFVDGPEKDGRKNVVVFGALGAVVLAAGAFLFLGGGSADEEVAFTPVKRAPRVEAPAAVVKAAVTLPAASNIKLGRNPFRALYVEPKAAPVVVAPPAPAPVPVAPAPVPIIVVTNGGAPSSGETAAPKPVAAQSTVKLMSVSAADPAKPVGTFILDGKQYKGAENAVLAGKLLVLDLKKDADGDWFAILRLGDGSPFEVHMDQEVVVQ